MSLETHYSIDKKSGFQVVASGAPIDLMCCVLDDGVLCTTSLLCVPISIIYRQSTQVHMTNGWQIRWLFSPLHSSEHYTTHKRSPWIILQYKDFTGRLTPLLEKQRGWNISPAVPVSVVQEQDCLWWNGNNAITVTKSEGLCITSHHTDTYFKYKVKYDEEWVAPPPLLLLRSTNPLIVVLVAHDSTQGSRLLDLFRVWSMYSM